ncbi:hypothetical protein KP509_21G057500 [Ceratopteris richardii]|nr:hypothetical protein KP509_21G057500 [Ceratopteris richardii]
MTQMTSQGDEQGNWTVHDVPPLSQCSPGGTTLEQGEADFFIAGPSGPIRDQASRHLRKKAKSQKIIESENLWHKLTDGPKVGICTDPLMKVNGHISQGYQAEFAAHGHLTPGTTVKVGHPPLSKDDGFSDAYLTGMEIKRNPQSSMKSGRRHGLKACARLQHLAIQGQGNNSGCLGQSSGADMLTASEGSRHSMLPSGVASVHAGDEFMDFKSIEVVEDWQSYCPYLPFSAYLIHVYEDGKPREISLPIFGSSRVSPSTDKTCPDYYDLVLNAGGSIWALDWCPHRTLTADLGVEFLAVGAHPHDSPTHRLGEVVLGKGLIQIWAFDLPQLTHAQTKWHYNLSNAQSRGNRKGRNPPKGPTQLRRLTPEDEESSMLLTGAESAAHEKPPLQLEGGKPDEQVDIECEKAEIAESVLASHVEISDLPKMVLGLAHDGGVVWDAKWQPISTTSIRRAGHLGNLAAVYGDGSIEVYDVPMPSMVRKLKFFSESSAPLIVKMKPAFKCSGIISCGQKSLPLTVEWSSSSPHNLLLVGCHDGAVALWKFTPQGSSCLDVKPLACFVADSAPVRALAFAPHGSDPESRNIFVTGGHSGRLLFWDFRDPFHPLWELSLSKGGCIFSIDWLLYPRGIVLSLDDGTIRTVSLDVALSDPSLTGTPPAKTPSQGVRMDLLYTANCQKGILPMTEHGPESHISYAAN